MKYHILILLALVFPLSNASALQVKDLVGNWRGTHREVKNGTGVTYQIVSKGTRRKDGTIQLVETVAAKSLSAKYVFKKNGSFSCETVYAGFYIISSYRGSWKAGAGQVSVSGSGTLGKLSGKMKDSNNGFTFSGTAGSTKIKITARNFAPGR